MPGFPRKLSGGGRNDIKPVNPNPMKTHAIYICSKCDAQFPKWQGRCTECNSWGTVTQGLSTPQRANDSTAPPKVTKKLSDISFEKVPRLETGIEEFDRVLGGGIVPSSVILIGGEPGIGKSTLILQVASLLKKDVLYISGEESGSQIKMRLDRVSEQENTISFLGETHLESICSTIEKENPALAIVDSIQTIYSEDIPSEPGSVSQVRAATVRLLETAKKSQTAIFIIGHITKEGVVAGPKTLEHLVDTVIYLEGDRFHSYRILRAIKNRFGSTNEVGIFEMAHSGLKEVKNPSALFLTNRNHLASGSIITPALEGSRIFLTEVQALVTKTSFGYPQRKAQGLDVNRLNLLTAVLQKRTHLPLEGYDIHINITGGLKITEPAVDLAVCMAIISAYNNKVLDMNMAAFGEVGLGGEIRRVNQAEKRIQEAEKLGFTKMVMPDMEILHKTQCDLIKLGNIHEIIEKFQ